MLINRFIGGSNITSVLKTSTTLLNKGFIPILDYAKESSTDARDVINYVKQVESLAKNVSDELPNHNVGYALKLSSFLPLNPSIQIGHLLGHIDENTNNKSFVFFDAEQSALKDREGYIFTHVFEKAYRLKNLAIFKTYQMYRKDSLGELKYDMEMYPYLNVKLVRGAYHSVDDHALYQTKDETDVNYNNALRYIVNHPSFLNKRMLCAATHNAKSIDIANSCRSSNIVFAQLLGMGDEHSNALVEQGRTVFKYVPYGRYEEIFPYLMRRLYENKEILKHA